DRLRPEVLLERLVFVDGGAEVGPRAVAQPLGVVLQQDGELGPGGLVLGVELPRLAEGGEGARAVEAGAEAAAELVVLQDPAQVALAGREPRLPLHRLAPR